MDIYIAKNGTQTGPFSDDQVHGMITGGLISADDLAWHDGITDWQPIKKVLNLPETGEKLNTPPPLPEYDQNSLFPLNNYISNDLQNEGSWLPSQWTLIFSIIILVAGCCIMGFAFNSSNQSNKAIEALVNLTGRILLLVGILTWIVFGVLPKRMRQYEVDPGIQARG